jgi:hypothetical protein
MTVLEDAAPCSLVEFTSISEVLTALIMKEPSTSETSTKFYQTTWRKIPEDSHLQLIVGFQQYKLDVAMKVY